MKKISTLLLALALSSGLQSQDTSYVRKHGTLYRVVATPVADSAGYRVRRRSDRAFVYSVTAAFVALTVWYFSGSK